MKGLRKVLTPFAPDQSGAVSVLYELGGLIVVCDAGGCTGNICGFDEPRWTQSKSAIFSAGLRDMDAIMGRDKQLVDKLAKAVDALKPEFAAIVGTPVPACIGTDYQALAKMAEKKTGIPVLALDTSGMKLADAGASKAYLQLMKKFAEPATIEESLACDAAAVKNDSIVCDASAANNVSNGNNVFTIIGVLGANPLELGSEKNVERIEKACLDEGVDEVWFYGLKDLSYIRNAGKVTENLVVSPSGLAAAKYLQEQYGTPYRIANPAAYFLTEKICGDIAGEKVLVAAQFVTADTIRWKLLAAGAKEVQAATWFMLPKEMEQPDDLALQEEDQFVEVVQEGRYDRIIADPCLKVLVPFYQGKWTDLPEFAISGKLE